MSKPYVVDGRTFTPGELCLVFERTQGWVSGVIVPQGKYIGIFSVWVHANHPHLRGVCLVRSQNVLLLSENFAPGLPPDLPAG